MPPLLAGIDWVAGKVTVEPPAIAETAPVPLQVVLAFGVGAIVTPAGKVSMNGALKVAALVLGLDSVMVRVETLVSLMRNGLKPLPSVGRGVVETAQMEAVITLVSIVTAPFCAKALPDTVAPVFSVIDSDARIFPTKIEFVSIVAELPTCQKTLQG